MEIPPEAFNAGFQVSVMGMVYCCREVLGPMEKRGSGSIILIGATAAFRGGAGFSSFAVSKFGQRALAQSIAREYGSKGVHVAHVNIDGVIESERSKSRMPDRERDFFLQPADIAEDCCRRNGGPELKDSEQAGGIDPRGRCPKCPRILRQQHDALAVAAPEELSRGGKRNFCCERPQLAPYKTLS